MQDGLFEIRWHGRGGQGAVTASKILAEAALAEGKFIQSFPEFGPERTGAPVRSYTRISSRPILIHSPIIHPDTVVLLDPSLLATEDICQGLKPDGVILVNTKLTPVDIRKKLNLTGGRVFTVDATGIAIEKLGRNIPNTPVLGALVKITGLVQIETLINNFKEKYSYKFAANVIQGNLDAINKAASEVQKE